MPDIVLDLARAIVCSGDRGKVASYSVPLVTENGETVWLSSTKPLDAAGWQALADSVMAAKEAPDGGTIEVEAEDGTIIGG